MKIQIKNARVGSTVLINVPNGMGRNGQEWKEVKARVHIVMPTHLVCVVGGCEARPHVAESYRLVRW